MGDKGELTLYVWTDVFVDYTSGLAVALAHDSDEARELIVAASGIEDDAGLVKRPHTHLLRGKPVAYYIYGGG